MSPTLEVAFRSVEIGVLIMTSAIVWWYTRETSLLRKAAQDQNELLKQQVGLAREAQAATAAQYEAELERASAQVAPIVGGWGGRYSQTDPHDATLTFTNKGGLMRNLSVEPLSDFTCSIKPTGTVAQGERAEIQFNAVPLDEPSPFVIHYDNLFGKRRSIDLEYQRGNVRDRAS